MNVGRFAGVVTCHHDRIALVRQRWDEYRGDYWTIPGGAVRARETPAQGALRELAEETGLEVAVEGLRLVSTSSTTQGTNRWLAWNFTVAVEAGHLVVADPHGEVLEAHWWWPTSGVGRESARTGATTRPTSRPSSRWAGGRDVALARTVSRAPRLVRRPVNGWTGWMDWSG